MTSRNSVLASFSFFLMIGFDFNKSLFSASIQHNNNAKIRNHEKYTKKTFQAKINTSQTFSHTYLLRNFTAQNIYIYHVYQIVKGYILLIFFLIFILSLVTCAFIQSREWEKSFDGGALNAPAVRRQLRNPSAALSSYICSSQLQIISIQKIACIYVQY